MHEWGARVCPNEPGRPLPENEQSCTGLSVLGAKFNMDTSQPLWSPSEGGGWRVGSHRELRLAWNS